LISPPGTKKIHTTRIALIAGALVVLLIVGFFFIRIVFKPPDNSVPTETISGFKAGQKRSADASPNLPVGEVFIKNRGEEVVSRLSPAVFSARWIALPIWSLAEARSLIFRGEESEEIRIHRGLWTSGDPIVLLDLESEIMANAPELVPFSQGIPLEWRPSVGNGRRYQVDISPQEKRGAFLCFALPEEIRVPGVFLQEGRIVGWSYPEFLSDGYLWAGSAGHDLFPNFQADQLFRVELPRLRTVHFLSLLRREEEMPPLRKLEAFAEGFRMENPFREQDIPTDLQNGAVVARVHSLAAELIQNGFASQVARILDEDILVEAQDVELVKDAVMAKIESEDHNRALQFLGKIKNTAFEMKGKGIDGLDQFHAHIYKNWLRSILDHGGYYSGMVAFEEAKRAFPDDIEIHLLGVEVALADKNWTRARELLQIRDYPENLREWVGQLENEIQEVQENEGAITIRFNPGTSHIPVRVYLNGTHAFRFILDTGATVCSIPSSAVERLGLDIDQNTPVRLISTAGGIAETYEVKLESIELEGARVFNVAALIIDIPGYRDYGLLGQNFLNVFHIEIDNQRGILRLRKK
jgi:clan AA aspartic protease (TIGR02281 family)